MRLRDGQAPYISQAADAQDLVSRLSLMAGHEVVPGRTLVFLDEVQEAPDIVTLSKYLVQDGRFRLAMSGSLLGVERYVAEGVDAADELARLGLGGDSIMAPPPGLSDFS